MKPTYDNYTDSMDQKVLTTLKSPASAEYLLAKKIKLKEGRHYRPEAKQIPPVDSLLLIHPFGESSPILLMFQITRSGKHDVKVEGLRKVDELHSPTSPKKYYVVVTPETVHPQLTVPIERFEKDKGVSADDAGKSADEKFPVFHYLVRLGDLFRNSRSHLPLSTTADSETASYNVAPLRWKQSRTLDP